MVSALTKLLSSATAVDLPLSESICATGLLELELELPELLVLESLEEPQAAAPVASAMAAATAAGVRRLVMGGTAQFHLHRMHPRHNCVRRHTRSPCPASPAGPAR